MRARATAVLLVSVAVLMVALPADARGDVNSKVNGYTRGPHVYFGGPPSGQECGFTLRGTFWADGKKGTYLLTLHVSEEGLPRPELSGRFTITTGEGARLRGFVSASQEQADKGCRPSTFDLTLEPGCAQLAPCIPGTKYFAGVGGTVRFTGELINNKALPLPARCTEHEYPGDNPEWCNRRWAKGRFTGALTAG
jgi:hypothetical protein